MIQYVELPITKDAHLKGCKVSVQLPQDAQFRKLMVKNNTHIRFYYETFGNLLCATMDPTWSRSFFLAPTGVNCPEQRDYNYLDSVELYSDTVVFHVYSSGFKA